MDQDELGVEIGLSPSQLVLDGDPAFPKGAQPPILAHFCYGRTAGWIKTPLGTEVDFDSGDIVLHGKPAPPKGRAQQPPLFGPCIVAKRMDESSCHLAWR